MPLIGDLVRLLQSQMGGQGPVAWDAARQLALSVASPGGSEANVDPAARIALEELARVAEMHVATATGLRTATGSGVRITAVNRSQWAVDALGAYRSLFDELATALDQGGAPEPPDLTSGDPTAFLGPLFQMMAPMRAAMMAGSLVGNLATTAFGPYPLPVARDGDELPIVVPNVDEFAESWSLPIDELRLWVLVHELTSHTLLRVPHLGGGLRELISRYTRGFETDPEALERRMGDLDPTNLDPTQLFGDPELLLGAVESPAQTELRVLIDARVATIVGVVDHLAGDASEHLLGSTGLIREAVRRRRGESDSADQLARHLLGLDLSRAVHDRGAGFVQGVLERADADALSRLWTDEDALPTPAELDAPGLWLARLELTD
jgi:putative hydrolase